METEKAQHPQMILGDALVGLAMKYAAGGEIGAAVERIQACRPARRTSR